MKRTIGGQVLALLLSLSLLLSLTPAALAGEAEQPTDYSVTLDQNTLTLTVGQTATLNATVRMADGQAYTTLPEGYTAQWTVAKDREDEVSVAYDQESPLQATVKAQAVAATNEPVKEVSVTATITREGESQGKEASCKITVAAAEQPGVTVTPDTLELSPIETAANHTGQLRALVTPSTGDQTVAWNSGDTSVATVSASGLVTGVSAGKAQITATSAAQQAACTVTVLGLVFDKSEKAALVSTPLRVGDNYTLDYTIYGESLQSRGVTWSSSDTSVVRVENGYLYAIEEGTATVTAKINGVTYSDSVLVTVKQGKADVIHTSAGAGAPLNFSALLSQLQTQSAAVLRQNLSYVSGLSVDPDQGTLYCRYSSEEDTGLGVGTSERYYVSPGAGQLNLADVTFVPKPDFEGTAVIYYTGYASGSQFFQGTIEVSVELEQDVSYSVAGGKAVQFKASDFAQVCRNRTGRDLSYVTFSLPDSGKGTLYYNYLSAQNPGTPVAVTDKYKYTGVPSLDNVYFVPAANTSGQVIFLYTAWDVNGTSYRGRVSIQVTAAAAAGDITYSIGQGGQVSFDNTAFQNLSLRLTGYNLDHVRFTLPAATQGTLYYNYISSGNYASLVSESRDYYRTAYPYLDRVTFVAASSYTGAVSIPFTAWDIRGNRFYGEVGITVSPQGTGTVRYAVFQGGQVTFNDTDFNTLCVNLTGSSLRYVRFTLPASSQGAMYYKYTSTGSYESKVSDGRSYYRTASPYLDNITFVASGSYTGTVSIPFTGWNINGKSFSGAVEIDVENAPDPLKYQVSDGNVLTFEDDDFNDYCLLATGENLNYVRFTLPSSAYGTLYYNYRSSGSYDSKVTSGRNYYRLSSPYLERVSFVPNSDYAGTFSLNFTGWSTGGRQFSGTVTITVTQGQPGIITYTTSYQPVVLRDEDFISACNQRGRGTLVSVQFTGADDIQGGHLYYHYGGIHSTSSQVRTNTTYYPSSSPRMSELSFVPLVGFQGTVSLTYTAKDSKGGTYEGEVQIRVVPNTASRYFIDMGGFGWAAAAVDFLYESGVVIGADATRYAPQAAITRGSFIVMLDRAFSFPSASGYHFSDVPDNAYYAQAIQRGYGLGVIQGYPDGGIHPDDPITREAAAVMLYRAMQVSGWSMGAPDESALYDYEDWKDISGYARNEMSVLVKNGLFSGNDQKKLQPGRTMTRAEMAAVLARALTI